MDFTFDKNFKTTSWAMHFNKSHPSIKRNWKWLLQFALSHCIFTSVFLIVMYNIIFINIKTNNFDDACRNGVFVVVFFVITFEHFIMTWKQDTLNKILAIIEKDYKNARNLPVVEQKIVEKHVRRGAYVCNQWFLIAVWGCLIFPIKNIILLIHNWAIGDPKLILMIQFVYPDFVEEKKDNNIYVYLVLYAWLLFFDVYAVVMYVAFVPLGPIFLIHACGQLELVEKKIGGLFQGNLTDTDVKLKEIIRQLQYIYSFVDQIQSVFKIIYELTLRGTTVLLPITVYQIIGALNKGDLPLEFISFIVGGIIISSSPCYYGDRLMEMGDKVRTALYTCGWESVPDRRIRRTITIIMIRTLKPAALRSLFRTICLETLADLLRQSYALFNLMNSVWK